MPTRPFASVAINSYSPSPGHCFKFSEDPTQSLAKNKLSATCTMTRVKIKGAACSIYCENHRQTAMYTVAVVYGSYTLEYNFHTPRASCIHGYKLLVVLGHNTSHLDYSLIVVYLNSMLEAGLKPLGCASWFKCPPLAYCSNKPL